MPISRSNTWPASLRDLAEIVGATSALRLSDAFGGLDGVYVAKRPTPASRIAQVIGVEGALRLAERFGGSYLYIARGASARSLRPAILAATGSNAQVARRLRCSQRRVRQVRSEARRDGEPDFFDPE